MSSQIRQLEEQARPVGRASISQDRIMEHLRSTLWEITQCENDAEISKVRETVDQIVCGLANVGPNHDGQLLVAELLRAAERQPESQDSDRAKALRKMARLLSKLDRSTSIKTQRQILEKILRVVAVDIGAPFRKAKRGLCGFSTKCNIACLSASALLAAAVTVAALYLAGVMDADVDGDADGEDAADSPDTEPNNEASTRPEVVNTSVSQTQVASKMDVASLENLKTVLSDIQNNPDFAMALGKNDDIAVTIGELKAELTEAMSKAETGASQEALKEEFTNVTAALDTMKQENSTMITSIQSELQKLQTSVGEAGSTLDNAIGELTDQGADIEDDLLGVQTRVEELEDRAVIVQSTLDRLDSNYASASKLSEIQAEITGLTATINSMDEVVNIGDFEDLEDLVHELDTALDDLDFDDLASRVEALENIDIDRKVSDAIDGLERKIDASNSRMGSKIDSALRSNNAANNAKFTTQTAVDSAIQASESNTEQMIQGNTESIKELAESSADALTNVEGQLDADILAIVNYLGADIDDLENWRAVKAFEDAMLAFPDSDLLTEEGHTAHWTKVEETMREHKKGFVEYIRTRFGNLIANDDKTHHTESYEERFNDGNRWNNGNRLLTVKMGVTAEDYADNLIDIAERMKNPETRLQATEELTGLSEKKGKQYVIHQDKWITPVKEVPRHTGVTPHRSSALKVLKYLQYNDLDSDIALTYQTYLSAPIVRDTKNLDETITKLWESFEVADYTRNGLDSFDAKVMGYSE